MPVSPSDAYASRTKTWAAGDQVASADLNAIQDGVIAVSQEVVDLGTELNTMMAEEVTCTAQATDSPAPSVAGARTVWIEEVTNDTAVVVLDASINWRDRYCILRGYVSTTADDVAGGANDATIAKDLGSASGTEIHAMFYSEAGQTGSGGAGYEHTISGGNVLRFFARSTDGALCMRRTTSGTNYWVVAELRASPDQGHV